ncbi:hypothetical protein J2Y45_006067 [Dyadobacter sp. BE34]|uniref:SEFIR domain-containing protein n=1 Tax=Dyadobacter fermentans TaxID=94254 RepID=A0ABU1R7F4_9BACT|nr:MULTISPECIES: toll/interleukin-1 receptor domain-containing protein [Dyadobacter]MDR6808854.1 hypothetical protein [Dyadobacter fermentans]MDR7046597.1 hypothetical protein [Dyadobacter sp. BE242]MDR7200910.1 hypothetical protein [Dyadobacter sp. BE34]MDR7218871.1 hypothetical protein [Dyadobacter sp. BE31]MDR7264919.1 hypothetical protein [Dyadobacter sp. BE32]
MENLENEDKGYEAPKVFISYSHDSQEHKSWVLRLASRLRSNGVDVILDQWNLRIGSNLALFMELGLSKANRVVCICTDRYNDKANNGKGGAGYEKTIFTAELLDNQNTSWVLPLIRTSAEKSKTPTCLKGRMYIDFTDERLYESNYIALLRELLDEPILPIPEIGKNPFRNIEMFSQQRLVAKNERFSSPSIQGTVDFDYSNNDGLYNVGTGNLLFEIQFSRAGTGVIYVLSDSDTIDSVASAGNQSAISGVGDASKLDYTSRSRTIYSGQVAVFRNVNGFYCAIKILHVEAATNRFLYDEVLFDYRIQTDGTPIFN